MNIEQMENYKNPNLLLDLLINSNDDLCLDLLKKIRDLAFSEKDFYQRGINTKMILFKSFSDKCKDLLIKYGDIQGTYSNKVNSTRDKILKNLQNGEINFGLLKLAITEDEDFEKKIKLILSNEEEGESLYNKLKENYEQFQKDFNDVEIVIEFYSTFYPNSKEELINSIKEKHKEYKEKKMIKELINMDIKNFFNIKNFYLKEAIEESII